MPHSFARFALLVAFAVPLSAGGALAQSADQTSVPTREGNIWNGRAHEPNPASVPEGPPSQQRRQTDELEQLNQQLQTQVEKDTAPAAVNPPAP